MSFDSICSQLQSCLGSASIFPGGENHIAIADQKIYAQGLTPVAVINIDPQLQHSRESFGGNHLHTWRINLIVGAQWRSVDESYANLAQAWQGVLEQIDKYPHLGLGGQAGIRDAFIDRANLQPFEIEYGTVKYGNVLLSVVVVEEVDVEEAE